MSEECVAHPRTVTSRRPEGSTGLYSQSATVADALCERLALAAYEPAGSGLDAADLLERWEDDERVRLVVLCLDALGDPRRFAAVASRVGRRKPVLLFETGRPLPDGESGSRLASAVTPGVAMGALAAATGLLRFTTLGELVDTARLLAAQPLPRGRRVALVGDPADAGTLIAAACERAGLVVAGSAADADALLAVSPGLAAHPGKTMVACSLGRQGADGPVPHYPYPDQAIRALARAARYAEWRRCSHEPPAPAPVACGLPDPVALLNGFGISVTAATPPGVEVIVGAVNHLVYGPLVMVQTGGPIADLLVDRSFRVPPFGIATAAEMIADLHCSPLLYGYRGRRKADTEALAALVRAVGQLILTLPEVAELELSPVTVTADGAVVTDTAIRLVSRA
ncbi:acetate--CoA ligase family protein [Acrocarpospora catenulata]|uniref:acetate--CoA ligase family protein n=1 Tax=Acrocarpospora catenulata TaxID=2836182 RepID=UPI001BD9D076|nr:acetate--CoA ligase family protein [Acrocarpospora catenulata]